MVVRGLSDLEAQRPVRPQASSAAMMGSVPALPSVSEMIWPGAKWRSFITAISGVDVLMFIATLIVGATRDGAFVASNNMAGPSGQTLIQMGALNKPLVLSGQYYRLLTPIILHAGLQHIGLNLFFQCNVGFRYEELWGTNRMVAIYWLAGLGGTLLSALLIENGISVGASGALMGLLGAQIAFLAMNWADVPNAPQELFQTIMLVFLNFLFGLTATGIDNAAHLGGLLSGFLVGIALINKYNWRGNDKTFHIAGMVGSVLYFVLTLTLLFTSSTSKT